MKGQEKDRVDLLAERGNFKEFTTVKRPSYTEQKLLALDVNAVKLNNLRVRDITEGGVEGAYFPLVTGKTSKRLILSVWC